MLHRCKIYSTICVALAVILGLTLKYAYQVKTVGTLKLKNAWGEASIRREKDTQIAHIMGRTWNSVLYAQGFAHAQTRLWQLEKTRRFASGQMSELFGSKTLMIDKFMRSVGLKRMAIESVELLEEEEKEMYQAYADGINDYVAGVSIFSAESTGRALPPEFIAFGISTDSFKEWTMADSMSILRLLSFQLSWNWQNDLVRESLR